MIKHIILKEIKDNLSSTKFIVTFSVCSVLILLSFIIGATNFKIAQMQYEAAKNENTRQLEGLTNWMMVNDYRIFLPPQPLAALVTGVSNDIGRTIEIGGTNDIQAEDSIFGDEPIFAIFRFLDLEFIFQIVLSLFAILFAYDSINGEKERGTLKLTFSYPVSRSDFILGKLFGSFFSLIIPLLIPFMIGMVILPALGVNLTSDEWIRLMLIILNGFVFTSVFLLLSIFVSALTEKSSNSFLYLLGGWIFFVMIIPRISFIAAGSIINVPSLDEINSQKARLSMQLWSEDRKAINSFSSTKTGNPEELMKEFNAFMQKMTKGRQEKIRELTERLYEERENKQNSMIRLAFGLASLSPVTSFSLSISTLAGTSVKLQEQFYKNAKDYKREYSEFMKKKTGMDGSAFVIMRRLSDDDTKENKINLSEIPAFQFKKASLSENIAYTILYTGILFLFCIAFFAASFYSFRKYDVR